MDVSPGSKIEKMRKNTLGVILVSFTRELRTAKAIMRSFKSPFFEGTILKSGLASKQTGTTTKKRTQKGFGLKYRQILLNRAIQNCVFLVRTQIGD